MRPPPLSYATLNAFLVTTTVALAAIAATGLWWNGYDVDRLLMTSAAFHGQPWRLFTCTLLHVNFWHIAFNLYMFWFFGTFIEDWFGHLRAAALIVFLGVGASAGSALFHENGVGLSGVVYGQFAFVWVLSRFDERFLGILHPSTTMSLVGWFFLCILLSYLNIWHIANAAHGAGALFGLILGFAVAERARVRRYLFFALAVVGVGIIVVVAARRMPDRGAPPPGLELAQKGVAELNAGRPEQAIELLRQAVAAEDSNASYWNALGAAEAKLQHDDEAAAAFGKALQLEPGHAAYRKKFASFRAQQGQQSEHAGDENAAIEFYKKSLEIDGKNAAVWFHLGRAFERTGKLDEAREAVGKAVELQPNEPRYQVAQERLAVKKD